MCKTLVIYFAFIISIFSLLLIFKKTEAEIWRNTDGPYVLSVVSSSGEVTQLDIFGDAQWGYYLCETEKGNMIRRMGSFLQKPNVQITCGKLYLWEM